LREGEILFVVGLKEGEKAVDASGNVIAKTLGSEYPQLANRKNKRKSYTSHGS
jgi:hypothetical protein